MRSAPRRHAIFWIMSGPLEPRLPGARALGETGRGIIRIDAVFWNHPSKSLSTQSGKGEDFEQALSFWLAKPNNSLKSPLTPTE
jgi:hypothetical protein